MLSVGAIPIFSVLFCKAISMASIEIKRDIQEANLHKQLTNVPKRPKAPFDRDYVILKHSVITPAAYDRYERSFAAAPARRVPLWQLEPSSSLARRLRLFRVFAFRHRFMRLTSQTIMRWIVLVLHLRLWLLRWLGSWAVISRWRLRQVFGFRLRSLSLRPQVARIRIIDVQPLGKRFFRLCFAFCGILGPDRRRYCRGAETRRNPLRKGRKPHREFWNTRKHVLKIRKIVLDFRRCNTAAIALDNKR